MQCPSNYYWMPPDSCICIFKNDKKINKECICIVYIHVCTYSIQTVTALLLQLTTTLQMTGQALCHGIYTRLNHSLHVGIFPSSSSSSNISWRWPCKEASTYIPQMCSWFYTGQNSRLPLEFTYTTSRQSMGTTTSPFDSRPPLCILKEPHSPRIYTRRLEWGSCGSTISL